MKVQDEHQRPNDEPLSRRPAPSRRFQDDLRRHLLELEADDRRPNFLWLLVAAYAAAGLVLLVIAAVGVGA